HRRRVVVLADRAADHDACLARELGEHLVEDLAADVVEIDIDAVRTVLLEAVAHAAGLVVDAGVETQLLDHPFALGRTARAADGAAALDLRALPDGLADRTRGARDDDRLAGRRSPDVHQPEVAGHARHAEHVEPLRRRAEARVELEEAEALRL